MEKWIQKIILPGKDGLKLTVIKIAHLIDFKGQFFFSQVHLPHTTIYTK